MSLPEFGGMDTGFNYYHGADPGEYDLVISNSEGGLGVAARARRPPRRDGLLGRRPRLLRPATGREGDTTSSSTATATSFAASGCRRSSASPRARLADVDFALGGHDFRGDTGQARLIGDIPFPSFPRAISAARINLCLTRRPHATVYASSSCRPFELAAAGAAIVANPYDGIERWFEPGAELSSPPTPTRRSRPTAPCSTTPAQAEEMGRRARERVLDEHTYRHRARRLLELLDLKVPAHVD